MRATSPGHQNNQAENREDTLLAESGEHGVGAGASVRSLIWQILSPLTARETWHYGDGCRPLSRIQHMLPVLLMAAIHLKC